MKKFLKEVIKAAGIGLITIIILLLLLLLVNQIPQKCIKDNMKESLEHFKEHDTLYNVIPELKCTEDDVIADAVILSIIWYQDGSLEGTLVDKCYGGPNSVADTVKSIENELAANCEYSRYWHGYQMLYRMLLCFMNIQQIKIFLFGIFILLFTALLIVFLHRKMYPLAIASILAAIATMLWSAFISLAHIQIFLIMCIVSIIAANKKLTATHYTIIGICTAFFDFLTVGTLTLALPLLIECVQDRDERRLRSLVKKSVFWLGGWAATFIMKFILTFNYARGSIERSTIWMGSDAGSSLLGLKLNLGALLPFIESNLKAITIIGIVSAGVALFVYLFHKQESNDLIEAMVFIIAIIYGRYILLGQHSMTHYSFTYRSQFVVIICVVLMLSQTNLAQFRRGVTKHATYHTNAMFKRRKDSR